MATKQSKRRQAYPRIESEDKFHELLDDNKLAPHIMRISTEKLPETVLFAIQSANKKSSREMIAASIKSAQAANSNGDSDIYVKVGKDLFDYFRDYSSDPASRAFQLRGRHCREIAREQFSLKALQKERMNSGWRYQYLAIECARATQRFFSVSDLGLKEADFNATISILGVSKRLGIYVSVKNRENTIGGPDWPKAIEKLEDDAISDKNMPDYYLCVFAFAMQRGERRFKRTRKKVLLSPNVELWGSDYFWPFFTNYSYEEIMQAVLQVLISNPAAESITPDVPARVIDVFEQHCQDTGLIDSNGCFNDPLKLVEFFCRKPQSSRKRKASAKQRVK
ncbi:MAG: hypothetical protein HC853_16250 [Anaerolineae bacterium]|nr:hypothetical protein [Anaerolineae bacterium]